jgi:hypothetical protein
LTADTSSASATFIGPNGSSPSVDSRRSAARPGDFDAVLATIDQRYVEHRDGDPAATLRILVSAQGEDALRIERIAEELGKTPHDVVSDLLRAADRPAA